MQHVWIQDCVSHGTLQPPGCGAPCEAQSRSHPVAGYAIQSMPAGGREGLRAIQDCVSHGTLQPPGCGVPCEAQSCSHPVAGYAIQSMPAGGRGFLVIFLFFVIFSQKFVLIVSYIYFRKKSAKLSNFFENSVKYSPKITKNGLIKMARFARHFCWPLLLHFVLVLVTLGS